MNLLDTASRIGQQMKTIPVGQEWMDLYTDLSETLSPEAWDTLLKIPTGYLHYYSLPHAMDVIIHNEVRKDIHPVLKDVIAELKGSAGLQCLCELSVTLGNNLNQMVQHAMSPNVIPKDFGQLKTSAKLSRSIQDLHTAFQRSGMLRAILRYLDPRTKEFPTLVGSFNERKSTIRHPLNRNLRHLIKELAQNDDELEMLSVMYKSDLLLDWVKQILFESHANRVVQIPWDAVQSMNVRHYGSIQPVVVRLDATQMGLLNAHTSFAKVIANGSPRTVVITGMNMRFGTSTPDQFRMQMRGYLFPESDVEVLA